MFSQCISAVPKIEPPAAMRAPSPPSNMDQNNHMLYVFLNNKPAP